AAEARDRLLDERGRAVRRRQIDGHGQDAIGARGAGRGGDLGARGVQAGRVTAADDHTRAFGGERGGAREPETAARSGDDGDGVAELEIHGGDQREGTPVQSASGPTKSMYEPTSGRG